jgi:TniQ
MTDGRPGLLPVRPRPFPEELFSSWLMRLAHDNAQRLPYFTAQMTGDDYFWRIDPDCFLRPGVAQTLAAVTGLSVDAVLTLTLRRYEGTVIPRLLQRGAGRWITPLYVQGYRRQRPGLSYCPSCLTEALFLRAQWRLSFVTVCERHACLLLAACPRCHTPYAPQRNDLGLGSDWSTRPEPPLGYCPGCGHDLRGTPPLPADPAAVAFQRWLLGGAGSGVLAWPGHAAVPSLEGFDVLHQLLAVVLGERMQAHLTGVCDLEGVVRPPERRNRAFEDFDLLDRHRLMRQLTYIVEDWPRRLLGVCEATGVTKAPLMANFRPVPVWYELVADQLSRANGRRPYKRVPLAGHLTLEELATRRDTAPTAAEQRRWDLLWRYAQEEETGMLPFARTQNVDKKLVYSTVTRYNAQGPGSIENVRRGKADPKRRLLSSELEAELHARLAQGPMTNVEMADWVEERAGKRPDRSTLWMYRRGVGSHSVEGRRASTTGKLT